MAQVPLLEEDATCQEETTGSRKEGLRVLQIVGNGGVPCTVRD